ncbi:UNVERIFIED_ORG: hypothetical protein EDC92_11456 [Dietzia maris]
MNQSIASRKPVQCCRGGVGRSDGDGGGGNCPTPAGTALTWGALQRAFRAPQVRALPRTQVLRSGGWRPGHEANSRASARSWWQDARSSTGANPPSSSSDRPTAASATSAITGAAPRTSACAVR